MKNIDDILKLRAVVLYIISHFPEGIDYIKLFKILYFAQQDHLVKYGCVLFPDNFRAETYGPVCGFIRKGLKKLETGDTLDNGFEVFGEGIVVINPYPDQQIISKEAPDMDELSVSNLKCLDFQIERFRDMPSPQISKLSHEDKAWIDAFERAKQDPQQSGMTIMEIARAGGANNGVLQYIKENLELDILLN